jgi:hypothetical protein
LRVLINTTEGIQRNVLGQSANADVGYTAQAGAKGEAEAEAGGEEEGRLAQLSTGP